MKIRQALKRLCNLFYLMQLYISQSGHAEELYKAN